jgi:hypothetical protein
MILSLDGVLDRVDQGVGTANDNGRGGGVGTTADLFAQGRRQGIVNRGGPVNVRVPNMG